MEGVVAQVSKLLWALASIAWCSAKCKTDTLSRASLFAAFQTCFYHSFIVYYYENRKSRHNASM